MSAAPESVQIIKGVCSSVWVNKLEKGKLALPGQVARLLKQNRSVSAAYADQNAEDI